MTSQRARIFRHSWHLAFVLFGVFGCSNAVVPVPPAAPTPPPPEQRPSPTLRGVAAYEDGGRAGGALIAITNVASGKEVAVVVADHDGRFEAALKEGEFALAVTADGGFGWVESMRVPNVNATVTVSRACRLISGRAKGVIPGTQVNAVRRSQFEGDIFVANVRADGTFSICVPEGHYGVRLRGPVVSFTSAVGLTGAPTAAAPAELEIEGFAAKQIEQPPHEVQHVRADLDQLVTDILRKDARVIGLGEATHGTAELVSSRSTLTFELIRRGDVRLVLFEFDALLGTAIDDYVMGGDVDLGKAVAALGFWITDTYELLRFFQDLRAHNATTSNKVHVWGVDVQNTEPSVALLLANARTLALTDDEKAMIRAVGENRGTSIRKFTQARRTALDALLTRLSKPRGTSQTDLRIATAARSLIVQVGYLDGDTGALYAERRDAGMASLASFLVAQTAAPRACVWAHAGHVAREAGGTVRALGQYLAADAANRYYPIGFFVYEGSVRAWDAEGAIGVISHQMPPAPAYTLEAAIMNAARSPEIAWLPVAAFSAALRTWTDTPRYVREVGAVYVDETETMTLRSVPTAFDAVVVIKSGHDSSPTPTGVRKAEE